ncbi:phosphatidylglycerophosphatase A family protein [Ectobacillus panaciterrae]|uniref:phosphatidylglycerophosphatase A family protein n=1 Tax=Ectobacillus panaciterrae TaxID=363872 RepID=UPI00042910C2|nr:phosphatidylglycerophosphatase A [Ectobacillus panaciterrae]
MEYPFVPSEDVEQAAVQALQMRGIQLEDIAQLTYFLQSPYIPDLTMEECVGSVKSVLRKREVQNTLLTGIELDILTEKGQLSAPLQQLIQKDESLYGVDEVLALSILNIYGSIGFTNYGYIDKLKQGVLERLNDKTTGKVNAFLDDLVGAIAAAASSRLAHRYRAELEQKPDTLS